MGTLSREKLREELVESALAFWRLFLYTGRMSLRGLNGIIEEERP